MQCSIEYDWSLSIVFVSRVTPTVHLLESPKYGVCVCVCVCLGGKWVMKSKIPTNCCSSRVSDFNFPQHTHTHTRTHTHTHSKSFWLINQIKQTDLCKCFPWMFSVNKWKGKAGHYQPEQHVSVSGSTCLRWMSDSISLRHSVWMKTLWLKRKDGRQ